MIIVIESCSEGESLYFSGIFSPYYYSSYSPPNEI